MTPDQVGSLLGELLPWLNEVGLQPYLWGGTLLGFTRESRLLPWDGDVDLGLLAESVPAGLADSPPAGWELYRDTPIAPWMLDHAPLPRGNIGLRRDGVKVGLHVMASGHDGWRYYTFDDLLVRVPEVTPLRAVSFLGQELHVPADSDKCLRWLYGRRWGIPDRRFCGSPRERARQHRYLVRPPA
jgi:hypothetical protein